LLLTGGASRRLGVDKAELRRDGERLADRAARLLATACRPALEVGPGASPLPAVREDPPGAGPLAAVAAGGAALHARRVEQPVLVLAVDLPFLDTPLLRWLADHPAPGAVVPRVDGVAQPLCARYADADLEVASQLRADGRSALRDLLAAIPVTYVDEAAWSAITDRRSFADVDTPEAARQAGLRLPSPPR